MAEQKNNKKEGKSFIDKLLSAVVVVGVFAVIFFIGDYLIKSQNKKTDNTNNTSQTGTTSKTTEFEECDIKGNISQTTGEKIYHLPEDRFYDKTEIDEASGEKYFCTEEEAENEGWRRSEV